MTAEAFEMFHNIWSASVCNIAAHQRCFTANRKRVQTWLKDSVSTAIPAAQTVAHTLRRFLKTAYHYYPYVVNQKVKNNSWEYATKQCKAVGAPPT